MILDRSAGGGKCRTACEGLPPFVRTAAVDPAAIESHQTACEGLPPLCFHRLGARGIRDGLLPLRRDGLPVIP